MRIIKGDLIKLALEGQFDIIIHGCNCQNTMGAGIAKTIKEVFPEAYEADLQTRKGDIQKLGDFTIAKITRNGHNIIIINAYTQFRYGKSEEIHTDYNAITSVMRKIKRQFPNKKVGYPKIGAGLGGGDWNIISKIIDEELNGMEHTLVIFG